MIAFTQPEEQQVWNDHVGQVFSAAILRVHGSIPTDEELAKWCRTIILKDGTHLLSWKAPEGVVDMKYVIASVKP